jgi:hypothetical protein
MKPTERLNLLHNVARKLGAEPRNIINLTLEQFKIGVLPGNRMKPFDYVLKQLVNAGDDTLRDLAAHLEIAISRVGTTEAAFWKADTVRIFISHLATQKDIAEEIREQLGKRGISGFVAHKDITPSRDWQNEIEIALNSSDALLALMGKGFHKSEWTDQEVGFSFARNIPIIPVEMGEGPYGFIARFQAYRFTDPAELSDDILKVLVMDARTSARVSAALVTQFEQSTTFALANYNLKLLRKLRYWDDKLLERLKTSTKRNNQIKGSFDVPEGVNALIKKIRKKTSGS